MECEETDLVVVGAGIYGLFFAATYHKLHPKCRIEILEASHSIGGPWASHRIFPGLKTNNLWGTYEHPDYPMDEARFGVKKGEHVPAEKVLEYLQAFAEDSGIAKLVRYNTRVMTAEKIGDEWKLQCIKTSEDPDPGVSYAIRCRGLVIATGLVNSPFMPNFVRHPHFTPPTCHSAEFPRYFDSIVQPGKHTLVIGAGKSAWDIAYLCATQPDATATMLIRPSGKGPLWMSPPYVTPLKMWLEKLVFTRFFGLMSPCPWAEYDGFEGYARRFLHGTWLGRKIVGAFWSVLGQDVVDLNQYNKHPETKKLGPWRDAFEVGNGLSILNYPTNFFDLVRQGKIKVVIAEVSELGEPNKVRLSNGETLQVDAIVCATGWESSPSIEFLPHGIEKELGLPSKGSNTTPEEKELIRQVESELYSRFPFLQQRNRNTLYHPDPAHRQSPEEAESEKTEHPYRLWRFMIPPAHLDDEHHSNIGFVGTMMTLGNATCAYLQALWMTAYIEGLFPNPVPYEKSQNDIEYETYRDTQYCAIRHAMGYGNKFPDLVFDSLPYFDLLIGDLLDVGHGKMKGGFSKALVKECFSSYGPEDYRGLVDLWAEINGDIFSDYGS